MVTSLKHNPQTIHALYFIAIIGDYGNIFYGVLEKIIEVQFGTMSPIHLFKCIWYDMNEGL